MTKPCAYNLTRREIYYRHDVFSAGLSAAGYEVRGGAPEGKPGNVMLIWNRYGYHHDQASSFERAGGTVVVAENGYLKGPKDGGDYYALARRAHNGAGEWSVGGPERWHAMGIDLQPWRKDGGHVLVCPNRPFGMPGMAMPADWASDVKGRLSKLTKREIRVRPHPGNVKPLKPLSDDLAGAWAVVIWASSAGVHALVAGIPVICEAPYWICKDGSYDDLEFVKTEHPEHDLDRLGSLRRLAWAQWNLSEIQTGEAFKLLG